LVFAIEEVATQWALLRSFFLLELKAK